MKFVSWTIFFCSFAFLACKPLPREELLEKQQQLCTAIKHQDKECVRYLLFEQRMDPNFINEDFDTPLHCAADIENITIISILLQNHAKKEKVDKDQCTPLQRAYSKNHKNAVWFLLSCGADPSSLNTYDEPYA